MFKPANRPATPIRLLISGPAGSGKTLTALRLACAIGRVAVIDTNAGAADWYADAQIDGAAPLSFDGITLPTDAPLSAIVGAIRSAEQAGYGVLVIDGLTSIYRNLRAMVDAAPRPSEGWARYNDEIRKLIAAIQTARLHVIVTMRTGITMAQVSDPQGRPSTAALGSDLTSNDLAYEVDYWLSMSAGVARVQKSTPIPDATGADIEHPGPALAQAIAQAHFRPAVAQEAPQATQVAPAPESPAGEAPMASGDDLPAQTASPASIAEVRAACGLAAKRRSVHTEEILDVLALHCGLTPGGKIETVPASRADLDALISELNVLGVSRG